MPLDLTAKPITSGTLFIVSAPSGAGKTTLVRSLLKQMPRVAVSVSCTTRPKRADEIEGVHYYFVSPAIFAVRRARGEFLEWAEVFGNLYGTPTSAVQEKLATGDDVILEIDWQGAQSVRALFPDAASIFITPPSLEVLEHRLRSRASDAPEVIDLRLREAMRDISHLNRFDYVIVNTDLDVALAEFAAIVTAERCRTRRYLSSKSGV